MADIYDLDFYRKFKLIIKWHKHVPELVLDQALKRAYLDEYDD